ncbi:ATP-binding protein [Streptomyces sp. PTM05]|uniref:ATP-binding protein n=1 Tax=Streptantibioticus parmotrematis TaxID=2873249 RepID=A0ABS7QJV3_9ACTN|nr:ATP-binding protein [Streptantibioticus parmotrematis]MBY8883466.1 ATP-binding protein [Streptantibioticus parmotrematis]
MPKVFDRSAGLRNRSRDLLLGTAGAGAADARDLVRELLDHGLDGRRTARPDGDVVLAVSELVTNALRHCAGPARMRVVTREDGLLVEVHDDSQHPARPRDARNDGTGGYGLHIVEVLADRWGNRRTPRGKAVWALFSWG